MKLTPAFQQWFGNSKVADAEGNPILMFHGTDKVFDEFSMKAGVKDSGWYGRGVYLTSDPATASAYSVYESLKTIAAGTGGANVMPVHVNLQNPYLWLAGRKAAITPEETDQLTKELVDMGYDGVIVSNAHADPVYASHYEVIAFHPAQVKSATGNRGTFDPFNNDIRFSFVDQDDEIATLAPVMPNPAFLKWFGDSKVVDAAGAPLVVFHGTLKSFNNFSVGDVGFHFGTLNQAESRVATLTQGLPDEGKNIMPVYLAIKNPLRTPDAGDWNNPNRVACMLGDMMVDDDAFAAAYERVLNDSPPGQDFKGILEAMGYDGIVYANVGEETLDFGEEAGDDSWIAFHPEQIKSAVGNCGDFDVVNPDIRFSLVDEDEDLDAEAPCP